MTNRTRVAVGLGLIAGALISLHPPWRAQGTTTRTWYPRSDGSPIVDVDTTFWTIPFAPIYLPLYADVPEEQLLIYLQRIIAGDTAAVTDWTRHRKQQEERVRLPLKLRFDEMKRSDSTHNATLGGQSYTISRSRVEIDGTRLTVYLLVASFLTAGVVVLLPLAPGRPPAGAGTT